MHPIRKIGYLIPISNANLEFYNESIPEQTGSKEVLTVSEAAEILRISKPCMYELAESGEIRSVKVGRRILISRTSLMEFISGKARLCEILSVNTGLLR